jgi:hypothetical protein
VAALAALAFAAVGCGSHSNREVVARVGRYVITRPELMHRMAELAPDHEALDAPSFTTCVGRREEGALQIGSAIVMRQECAQEYARLKSEALSSMISSYWLMGEATDRRLRVRLPPLVAGKLLSLVHDRERPISTAQAFHYYRTHPRRFERQERRDVYLLENLPTVSAAVDAKRAVQSSGGLANGGLHETVERSRVPGGGYATKAGLHAIFVTAPRVLGGPIKLNEHYAIFEVAATHPATRESFKRVQQSITRQLQKAQQRRRLTLLVASWRKKWIARTDCAAGYVVQKCRQFAGARVPEDALAFD